MRIKKKKKRRNTTFVDRGRELQNGKKTHLKKANHKNCKYYFIYKSQISKTDNRFSMELLISLTNYDIFCIQIK